MRQKQVKWAGRRFSVEIDIKVIVLQLTVLIISYSCQEVKRFFHDIACRFFAFFLIEKKKKYNSYDYSSTAADFMYSRQGKRNTTATSLTKCNDS